MPGISLIPKDINNYAIKWARKISNEPVENGKGFDITSHNKISNKIVEESELYTGTRNSIDNYDFVCEPKDIFVHNHPGGAPLSIDDISTAADRGVKKIFASTDKGYTAMDFTTLKSTISKNDMGLWTMFANQDMAKFMRDFQARIFKENISREEGSKIVETALANKLKEFADYTGALFENIKWTNLK